MPCKCHCSCKCPQFESECKTIIQKSNILANPNCRVRENQLDTINLYQANLKIYDTQAFNFEPCLTVNPKDPLNMAVTTHISDLRRDTGIYYTLDGGKTWTNAKIEIQRCMGAERNGSTTDWGSSSDPWVSFDKDGILYACYILFERLITINPNNTVSSPALSNRYVNIYKSTDKGQTWSEVKNVFNFDTLSQNDKYAVFGSRQVLGRVYVTGNARDKLNSNIKGITYKRSIDGGNLFESLINLVPPNNDFIWGSAVVELSKDNVILTMRNSKFDTNLDIGEGPGKNEEIYVYHSTDGGETFPNPPVVALNAQQSFFYDPTNGNTVRGHEVWQDTLINYKNNYLYIVTQDSRFNPNTFPDGFEFLGAGTVIIMSKDGGLTWSDPIPVNPGTEDSQAFNASGAVNCDGKVGVFYYTDRNHDYNGDDASLPLQTDVYLSVFDKDLNFLEEHRVTQESFNLRRSVILSFLGFPAFYLGDYTKADSAGKDFVWAFPVANDNATSKDINGENETPQTGGPLPTTPAQYTILDNQQYTKFARVVLGGSSSCKSINKTKSKSGSRSVISEMFESKAQEHKAYCESLSPEELKEMRGKRLPKHLQNL